MSGSKRTFGKGGINTPNLDGKYKDIFNHPVFRNFMGSEDVKQLAALSSNASGLTSHRLAFPASILRTELEPYEELKKDPNASPGVYEELFRVIAEKKKEKQSLSGRDEAALCRCNYIKDQGNALFKEGKYAEAIDRYMIAMRVLVGEEMELPSKGYLVKKYFRLCDGDEGWRAHLDLVACASNIAHAYSRLDDMQVSLLWVEEVEIIYVCQRMIQRPTKPAWIALQINVLQWYTLHMKAVARASQLEAYRTLGNTGLAWYLGYRAICLGDDYIKQHEIDLIVQEIKAAKMERWHHPEPKLVDKWDATNPQMQIRGVWKKINVEGITKPRGRHSFTGWIWRGRMYVAGGEYDIKTLDDFWCLDLDSLIWRRLPSFPLKSSPGRDYLVQQPMVVYNDEAWLFTGDKNMWKFDLIEEKWHRVFCRFKGRHWPYHEPFLQEHGVTVLDGVLYIFGGTDSNTMLGTNIFMSLDLCTLEWRHLGGSSECVAETWYPNLRRLAAFWAAPNQKRLYLLYGSASRSAAKINNKPQGAQDDYTNDDLWSYDLVEKTWNRERLRGNYPCPRAEMASVYAPKLGATGGSRAVVYGGYNATLPMLSRSDDSNVGYAFTFFGDTFLMDPTSGNWQHVLVRGFPSYRAQARLLVDEDNGKVYLFGGATNSDYVPSRHEVVRTFGDLWQLTLDCEGGWLDKEELERDAKRSTQVGPWRICATCANAGTMWKKCGGTCGGKVLFCSAECQRDGWKVHKEMDGCKKR